MISNKNKFIKHSVLLIVCFGVIAFIFRFIPFIDDDKQPDVMMPISIPVRLKITFKYGVELQYWPRIIKSIAFSTLLYPIELIESLRYKSEISRQAIDDGPIFIIGHWRSGTTYLQTIMTQDDQFSYSSLLEVIAPKSFHTLERDIFKKYLTRIFTSTNQDFTSDLLDKPGEEELAIASLCGHSYYFVNNYPSKSNELFRHFVLFENLSAREKQELEEAYIYFVKKLSYFNQNKTIILKNPVNTARVDFLLKLFPKAKFIHIHRNPLEIFESMKKISHTLNQNSQLEEIDEAELENQIIFQYSLLMNEFLKEKSHISEDRFVEVSYNNLVANPKEVMLKIYSKLNLKLSSECEYKFDKYLESQSTYEKNIYQLSAKNMERLHREWQQFILVFGYLNSDSEP